MAAQTGWLSVQEFHQLYDGAKPGDEYWYGVPVQKPVAGVLHGIVQFVMMMLLEKAGWNAASEIRLKVVPGAEPIPDVIAIRGKFRGRYPAAVAVRRDLSPDDTLPGALEKAALYRLGRGMRFG